MWMGRNFVNCCFGEHFLKSWLRPCERLLISINEVNFENLFIFTFSDTLRPNHLQHGCLTYTSVFCSVSERKQSLPQPPPAMAKPIMPSGLVPTSAPKQVPLPVPPPPVPLPVPPPYSPHVKGMIVYDRYLGELGYD